MADFGAHIPGKNPKTSEAAEPASALSSYMGYGSYSGVDIKVVVHYPNAERVQALQEAERIKLEVLKDVEDLDSSLGNTPELAAEYNAVIEAANEELERIDNEIARLNDMPTSKVLAELQTISWSTHRDKAPVRTLGSVYPRSFTRGHRTIAGSMVFTVFYEHVLHELIDLNLGVINTGTSDRDIHKYTTNLIDQVPPIDISIVAANEYGALSHMGLYGVEFVQDGGTFSIEDIFTESVVQYVARDIDPMRIAGLRKINGNGVTEQWTDSARGLAHKKAQKNAHLIRRSPFR